MEFKKAAKNTWLRKLTKKNFWVSFVDFTRTYLTKIRQNFCGFDLKHTRTINCLSIGRSHRWRVVIGWNPSSPSTGWCSVPLRKLYRAWSTLFRKMDWSQMSNQLPLWPDLTPLNFYEATSNQLTAADFRR